MNDTRRRMLMVGTALGLSAPVLALIGCGQPGGNNTSGGGAGNNTAGPPSPPTSGGETNTTAPANNTTGSGTPAGPGGSPPPPSSARIRYDVASPQGQAMLAIYAKAVGLMMALPDSDPRSWSFQWYSHWVRGGSNQAGKTSELNRIFGAASSPQKILAQKMWDGCQAHGDNEDENFFLPWHRMFLMAFENVVRSVAGEPRFTLPYWNYLDPGQRPIPAQFRRQGDPTWGPLYRSTRNPAVNAGGAIASAANLTPEILTEDSYSPLGADQGFCANLDFGLHGTVHVGVGNPTNGMGVIPWAAGDPVFWLHHCNIDRLWASWNAGGNANPADPDFTAKPFPFAGPDGSQITYTVGQVLSLDDAGYDYDVLLAENGQPVTQAQVARLEPSRRPAAFRLPGLDVAEAATNEPPPERPMRFQRFMRPQKLAPTLRALPSITHVSEGVRLGGASLRIRLASTQAAPEVAARTLAPLIAPPIRMMRRTGPPPTGRKLFALAPPPAGAPAPVGAAPPPAPPAPPPAVPAPKPGQKVFLVVNNLSTDIQPGVLYAIYLEAPAGRGQAAQSFQIGALNFFGAMSAAGGMEMASRARSFDITALAATLAAQGRLEASPALSFVPQGKAAGQAQPLIGSVSLAIQ